MLKIENLSYRVGGRLLFDNVDVSINPGHKVGFVGRNGVGKTTLLNIITGKIDPDGGSISVPAGWRVGVTTQEAPSSPLSLIDTVLAADTELARLQKAALEIADPMELANVYDQLDQIDAHTAEPRASRILTGLGFDDSAQRQPCSAFSGGWRMRVALAALLFTKPDLLLLDEPSNHLDLEANIWLEDFIKKYHGTVLIISHDRLLLDSTVNEILHITDRTAKLYRGNFSQFEAARIRRQEHDTKQQAKQLAKRKRIEQFVERFKAKASKARQAQSRIKMLERMQPVNDVGGEKTPTFVFGSEEALAPPLYSFDKVSLGYGDTVVLQNISLSINPDERLALLGANGNGKSTLMKALVGDLVPQQGRLTRAGKIRYGYFSQHLTDTLDETMSPIQLMRSVRENDTDEQLRRHLASFALSSDLVFNPARNLSGGERARMLFALIALQKPHVLLLDEPTNHLDMPSREALVQAINSFEGAVVLVSHDPYLLQLTVDRFMLVTNGGVQPFDGDLDDYRNVLLSSGESKKSGKGSKGNKGSHKSSAGGMDSNGSGAVLSAQSEGNSTTANKWERKKLAKFEKTVQRLQAKHEDLLTKLADPVLYQGSTDALLEAQESLRQVKLDLSIAEDKLSAAKQ